MAHFERRDIPKLLTASLLAAVHWFNPLAWHALRKLEDSIEWTCDDFVQINSRHDAVTYAKALLSVGEFYSQRSVWSSAIADGGLAGRIRRVLSPGAGSHTHYGGWVILSAVSVLLVLHSVRFEVAAREPDNEIAAALNAPIASHPQFFVLPVTTDFQKWRLGSDGIVALASVDGSAFADAADPTDMGTFDFKAFRDELIEVRKKCEPGILKIVINFGFAKFTPDVAARVEETLAEIAKSAGFEQSQFIKKIGNDEKYVWEGLLDANALLSNEAALGGESIRIFSVATPLGRYLSDQAEYYIDIPETISLCAGHMLTETHKVTLARAIVNVPEGAAVRLYVRVEPPQDMSDILDMMQVKKNSEFQRDGVAFLHALGFGDVCICVDVHSSVFYSRYQQQP